MLPQLAISSKLGLQTTLKKWLTKLQKKLFIVGLTMVGLQLKNTLKDIQKPLKRKGCEQANNGE
jgi:hypothetical protein